MSCRTMIEKMNELLDGELRLEECSDLESHLRSCAECTRVSEELRIIQQAVSVPVAFPVSMQRQMWERLREKRTWWRVAAQVMEGIRTHFRDFDRRVAASRLAAVPLTLACFILLGIQLPPIPRQQWTYSAFAITPAAMSISDTHRRPVMIHAIQRSTETNDLMETIWRIPYEDSLSFVAEVQPGGHAEIGNVLEYPKNPDLLEAFDVSLRNSQFELAAAVSRPFLIYSFQKVDVYEARTLAGVLVDELGTE